MKKTFVIGVIVLLGIVISACQTAVEKPTGNTESPSEVATTEAKEDLENSSKKGPSGKFVGKSDHITKGTARISLTDNGSAVVILEDDFDFDGAPAPVVALGKDGYKKETILGKLKKDKGRQTYAIPDTTLVTAYNEVWIWCTQVDAPLGVAKISAQ